MLGVLLWFQVLHFLPLSIFRCLCTTLLKDEAESRMCRVYKIPVLGMSMEVTGGSRREAFSKDVTEMVLLDDLNLCAYPYSGGLYVAWGRKELYMNFR